MSKKETTLAVKMTDEQVALLQSSYPIETSFNRILLPRLGFYSQDQTEGNGKAMKVIAEAGTFYTDTQSDEEEENEEGKMVKLWKKEEIGTEIEAIILYERRQLKYFDGEKYTSSPIYDTDEQIIPLFRDKMEVDRGTPAELKARKEYQGLSAKGKPISKLEDNKILYVLLNETLYQLNLRGTSMYAFMTYKRKVTPNMVLTKMNSEAKENGAISWSQITFEDVRPISKDEADIVVKHLREIKEAVEAEKAFYDSKQPIKEKEDF